MKNKLFTLLLILSSCLVFNVDAKNYDDQIALADNSVYCVRSEENNYGVKKKWEITNKNVQNALSAPCVDPSEKIYDYSNVLTEDEKENLRKLILDYEKTYKSEIVIVTIDMQYYNDSKNEEFAADFYDYNDFGLEYDHYSGTVLLRNTYSNDPYFNIYTFGDAQLYFSGSRTESILDLIYDDIHSGYYESGFTTFINELSKYHRRGIPSENKHDYLDENGIYHEGFNPPYFHATLISGVVTAIIIGVLVSKNTMVRKAKTADDYLDKNSINYTVNTNKLVNTLTTSTKVSSSSGGGGGSHSSGSSGGGHSSGGGRHG